MKLKFKCPKCHKDFLNGAECEDGILIVNCDICEFYEEYDLNKLRRITYETRK